MENAFYLKEPHQQNRYLTRLALKAVLINVAIGGLFFIVGQPFLVAFSLWISLQILAPFYDVPAMVKSGKMAYCSPLLLAEKETKGQIVLHGGTLFDYHFTINKAWNAKQKTSFVIQQYLLGLLKLIETKQDDIVLTGTSYILNARTAERLGFKQVPTNGVQKIILYFNAINLMVSASMIKGRWVIPPINRVNTYRATVSDIKANKKFIQSLAQKLGRDFEIKP